MKGTLWPRIVAKIWRWLGAVSIRTKIFGLVLGSTLLLSLAFAVLVRSAIIEIMQARLRDQGLSIARDVAARSTDLILINDLFALHQLLLETQAHYHDVRYVFVLDEKGQILAHTFGAGFPMDLLDVNTVAPDDFENTEVLQTEEGVVWDVAVPVFSGQAGTARVGISDHSLRQTMVLLTTQLGVTILAILAINLLAATLLTWILTRPILGLVEATRAVARGDFSPRVPRWADAEIGDLAEAFNHMAAELGRVDELRQEREQLRRQLLEGVITAQEDERRRIARELHDSTSQSLTSLKVSLRNLEYQCQACAQQAHLVDMRRVVDVTLDEVHALAVQLRPAVLDDLGLEAALERYVRQWQTRYHLPVDLLVHLGDQRLPEGIETALYRVIQEAFTNIARHAQAHAVSVLVERKQQEVVVVIEDDGQGFDPEQINKDGHLGLLGMRERTELVGGRLTIESTPGNGCSLFIRTPLPDPVQTKNGRPG